MAKSKFFNRELSWLDFNGRVLAEAVDPGVPLLERLKFLAITSSNLDEFFMVRVGGLQLMIEAGVDKPDLAGLTPTAQIQAIAEAAHQMVENQYACFRNDLEPQLLAAGICRIKPSAMTEIQLDYLEKYFESEIFPVATAMAAESDMAAFPLLMNRMIYIAVRLRTEDETANANPRVAFIPIGRGMSRLITLPAEQGYAYILIEDVIALYSERFFRGQKVLEVVPFRITRNADITLREDLAADLMAGMQEVLSARRTSDCVRLEIDAGATKTLLTYLQRQLQTYALDTYSIQGPLDLGAFMELATVSGFDHLRGEAWPPQLSPDVDPAESMFRVIAQKDVFLYHPYESFDPVLRLLEEAARDPDVIAIKQILYRTSRQSPIVAALMHAAKLGKYVTAIVELRARFDEERNIEWARALEHAGVQVIYGVKGLKTHAKLCMIVRREPQGIQRYMHFGTGNYNEITARIYSDASLMTCDEELGRDASNFFNTVTGYSQPSDYYKLEAAPTGLKKKILDCIEYESERKRAGQNAHIMAKINSLVHPDIIKALYDASQAGVKIDLNVRGICALVPGVPKLSENISVVSIVDRFLEHARLLYFHHGGDQRVYISSADWMPRNLDRRVELLVPVENEQCRARVTRILESYFKDNVKAWHMRQDGQYERRPEEGKKPFHSQRELYEDACRRLKESVQSKPIIFEPHQRPEGAV